MNIQDEDQQQQQQQQQETSSLNEEIEQHKENEAGVEEGGGEAVVGETGAAAAAAAAAATLPDTDDATHDKLSISSSGDSGSSSSGISSGSMTEDASSGMKAEVQATAAAAAALVVVTTATETAETEARPSAESGTVADSDDYENVADAATAGNTCSSSTSSSSSGIEVPSGVEAENQAPAGAAAAEVAEEGESSLSPQEETTSTGTSKHHVKVDEASSTPAKEEERTDENYDDSTIVVKEDQNCNSNDSSTEDTTLFQKISVAVLSGNEREECMNDKEAPPATRSSSVSEDYKDVSAAAAAPSPSGSTSEAPASPRSKDEPPPNTTITPPKTPPKSSKSTPSMPPRKTQPTTLSALDDDDDVTSKAAVALAAVAAAAVANHKSPALAAAQARAVAQSFLTVDQDAHHPPPIMSSNAARRGAGTGSSGSVSTSGSSGGPFHHTEFHHPHHHPHHHHGYLFHPTAPIVLQTVSIAAVKTHLRQRSLETGMLHLTEKLCQGENDAFLQHLLLLERFLCVDDKQPEVDCIGAAADTASSASSSSSGSKENPRETESSSTLAAAVADEQTGDDVYDDGNALVTESIEDADNKVVTAALAADKVISILKRLEGAFESLLNLLPVAVRQQVKQQRPPSLTINEFGEVEEADDEDDDFPDEEHPVVVPDLLPPCITPNGDATVAFFRECTSSNQNNANNGIDAGRGEGKAAAAAGEGTRERPDSSGAAASSFNMGTGQASDSADATRNNTSARSMFGSIFRRNTPPATNSSGSITTTTTTTTSATTGGGGGGGGVGLLGTLRRKTTAAVGARTGVMSTSSHQSDDATVMTTASSTDASFAGGGGGDGHHLPGEYSVTIEKEMLGLTVENVLERTVVRTVLAGGPAKKAGAKVGSLIVKVGNVETKSLTHFETIDELRQSQRPLHLVLKQISEDALRSAREEMGRLIRGSGFGIIVDNSNHGGGSSNSRNHNSEHDDNTYTLEGSGERAHVVRPLIGADLRIEAYTSMIRRRFAESGPPVRNKKEEALVKVGEKLVWILTLFVVGLEKEASRLFALAGGSTGAGAGVGNDPSSSPSGKHQQHHRNPHSLYHHSAKDYADAARSVAKVLMDYTRKKLHPPPPKKGNNQNNSNNPLEVGGVRRRNKGGPPPPMPGRGRGGRRRPIVPGPASPGESSMAHEKPLLQIGDVLQRTRTFLADTTSPPAALLRGELISFLCDVLDIDTEMELSEEENAVSATAGLQAGSINDLGSAGSLLKLIVLNCPIMRSPGCEEISARDEQANPDIVEELRRRFGPREKFSAVDLHRLHAGNRFLAVVHRLAASRSTSARITACSLGPVIWGHLDFPHQLQLRGVITRALHDVEVIVRKATATVLHEIAELVFDSRCVPWLVLMSERAMTDPEPQLRSAAMTLTWHLAEHLPNSFLGDASQGSRFLRRLPDRNDPIFADVYLLQCKLLPVATRLAEDRSPSVRLAVAAQCDRLCDALGDHWSSVVIDVLLGLLSDSDERVRCEAVMCVPRLAEIVLLSTLPGETAVSEVSILEALVPASIRLQKDPSSSVRVSLAAAAGEILTLLVALQVRSDEVHHSNGEHQEQRDTDGVRRYKQQVDERLIPLVQTLLNDLDPEVTSAALRAVTNASRKSAAAVLPPPRQHLQSVASEDDSASVASFHSHASREARAPVFLPVLSEVQVLRLLPTLTELANSRQWRVRQSAVEIVPALLGCTQKLETRSEISKLCIRLMSDKVDAVRATAAECLCMGGSSLGSHGEDASAEWITTIVIPAIRKCAVHTLSKQRLLSLKMIQVILENGACPSKWKGNETDEDRMTDSPMRELAVIALSLTQDRIANVRLNVGRVLEKVLYVFEDDELSFIKEVLLQQLVSEREQQGGGDRDVLFFAEKCVNRAIHLHEERTDESSAKVFT
jgi:PDZ domain